jgi:hypothetical protein
MGYRSAVAMLMYGEKRECQMVMDLLLQSALPDEDKEFINRHKQEKTQGQTHYVFWSFDNVKWYSELDTVKNHLFNFVDQIEDANDVGDPADRESLAIEFVRIGEDPNDNEREATERNVDWLDIKRVIGYPDKIFSWSSSG